MSFISIPLNIRDYIREIPDFPKVGILFRDIMPLMSNPLVWEKVIKDSSKVINVNQVDLIVGIEARGFIFGSSLASHLKLGFLPVRKKGKLPGPILSKDYDLEYGRNTLEIQENSFRAGSRIYIVDDLLATGGTANAAAQLVIKAGGIISGFGFIIELSSLEGRKKINSFGAINSLINYD